MYRERKFIKRFALVVFIFALIVTIALLSIVLILYKNIDFEADNRLFESSKRFESTIFYADNGEEEKFSSEEISTSGSIRKLHYSLEEINDILCKGFIAVEDKKFYDHCGIDIKRTCLATLNYITKREKSFGASTITQQVIKNISGDNMPTIKRKMLEIIRAIHIEENYSKEEILDVYLNVIPMSENIYGVGAAARAYFGKDPLDLTVAECATLIGITNAPTAYNPYNNSEKCLKKRNKVLSVLKAGGVINADEYNEAINSPLEVIPRENRENRIDSWFIEVVIKEICNDLCEKYRISNSAAEMMLLGGGYKVYTTMKSSVQKTLEEYFENKGNFTAEVNNGLNYAMCITDSHTGNLVGVVGRVGEKTGNRLLNHALVPHIPGSVIKPIALYAPLIDQGIINWATVFDDVPVRFIKREDEYIEYPKNSPQIYDGLTTIRDALVYSKNTIAVKLCNLIGKQNVYNNLRNNYNFDTLIEKQSGFTDIAESPMALGQLTNGVSLLRLTEAYSVFPSYGIRRSARSYLRVLDYNNQVVIESQQTQNRILNNETAKIMNQLLLGVTDEGTAKTVTLSNKIDVAGKTGTSGGTKDKLFIGYTPYYTAGIWCGYDNSGKSISGDVKSHLTVWNDVMTEVHREIISEGKNIRFSTEGLLYLPYCKDSGKRFGDICVYDPRESRKAFGYFSENNQPRGDCTRHILCLYDSVEKGIALQSCPHENIVKVALVFVSERSFPKQIYVTDSEFVYRDISGYESRPTDDSLPYFEYTIPEGEYVGISKGKKQFNSSCKNHQK